MPHRKDPPTIAAVDLGSNSFHMIVAHPQGDRFRVVDRLREGVRLAAGFDRHNRLTAGARDRALRCLHRFGQRIRHLPREAVRAVGTNALRMAREASDFLLEAEAALGHPIDIIPGHEEARLIYLGVSHGLADSAELRLVMDIGGGSTELIVGRSFEPQLMESLHMGCVSMSTRYFPEGMIDARRLRAAEIAARQEFEPVEEGFARAGWQVAIGASGTLLAINDLLRANRWTEQDGITLAGLVRLREAMIEAGRVERLSALGVSVERAPVLAGGLAITLGAFQELGIERMAVSDSALREGLLYDLMGRIHDEDVRERTVAGLMQRFQVDQAQVARVAGTASALQDAAGAWAARDEESVHLLRWAAQLHEIGHSISHSQYQKHGGYLLLHLDMPGFARGMQNRLAGLVRAHRRKLPLEEFATGADGARDLRLALLLRLAVVLHRARGAAVPPEVTLTAEGSILRLDFPRGWLEAHPLTRADLAEEADYLKPAGYTLKFK